MSIIVSGLTFHYQQVDPLFSSISFSVKDGLKASVIGNNGCGKSTLMRILAGQLKPSDGQAQCDSPVFYMPQLTSTHYHTIADAMGVAEKVKALREILGGSTDGKWYEILGDEWNIEEECVRALAAWRLNTKHLDFPYDQLSGGEKTKVLLAGVELCHPATVLLDEPTNHLDQHARERLYDWIRTTRATVLVVSHDVSLLNLMDVTMELSSKGLHIFGGNYDGYQQQREIERKALAQQIDSKKAAVKKAVRKAREVAERQEQRTAHGARSKAQGGTARILLNAKGSEAQQTTARLKDKQQALVQDLQDKVAELKSQQQRSADMKVDIQDARLHLGKKLFQGDGINVEFADGQRLWRQDLNIELASGDRLLIEGNNGSGKTTLLRIILGKQNGVVGTIRRADFSFDYMDQEYREVQKSVSVLEMAECYNRRHLPEHEVRLLLNRSLFPQETWDKNCMSLSGGERMRLYLCCMMIADQAPDMFVLDEPTNNLDLQSIGILSDTLSLYRGTLVLVSHDQNFVRRMGITKFINLNGDL